MSACVIDLHVCVLERSHSLDSQHISTAQANGVQSGEKFFFSSVYGIQKFVETITWQPTREKIHSLANWWLQERRRAQPSCTTWCADVAAARWQFGLNPRNDLGQMGDTAHACMRSSTRLGQYARVWCADALVHPLYGCMEASFASGRPPSVAHDVGGGDDNLF